MAIQQGRGRGKSKGVPKKGIYHVPKHMKKVREFDLAPVDSPHHSMSRRDREVQKQMKPNAYLVKRARRADTRGLYDPKTSKNTTKLIEHAPVEFKTQERANESIEQYEHRLRMEKIRIEHSMKTFDHKTSERRLEYKRERRANKAEKKRAKNAEEEKDLDFTGKTEHIAFGEVVERPPSFSDMKLPGEALKVGDTGPKRTLTNLEKLQQALKTTNSSIKDQFNVNMDDKDGDDSGEETTDPRKLQILTQQRKEKQKEREKMLQVAREKQRLVDLEKAKLQAQAAYQSVKSKRAGAENRVHMGTLTASTKTIYQAGAKAMRDLASVDGGVYHHGR